MSKPVRLRWRKHLDNCMKILLNRLRDQCDGYPHCPLLSVFSEDHHCTFLMTSMCINCITMCAHSHTQCVKSRSLSRRSCARQALLINLRLLFFSWFPSGNASVCRLGKFDDHSVRNLQVKRAAVMLKYVQVLVKTDFHQAAVELFFNQMIIYFLKKKKHEDEKHYKIWIWFLAQK